jgi:hypothetical protein
VSRSVADRQAADRMLAELYAISAYRCRWCGRAARHPHEDWCGRCVIPPRKRAHYARRIAKELGRATEDILSLWDQP